MPKTICLDFNGVLDDYQGWAGGKEYPPREGAKRFLECLNLGGFDVVILTAIDPEQVKAWLRKYGLRDYIKDVTNIKPPALVYVDDRAICFRGNYEETLHRIAEFRAYWEEATEQRTHR